MCVLLTCLLALTGPLPARADTDPPPEEPSTTETMREEAVRLRDLVESDLAREFLEAVPHLPSPETPRVVYYNRGTRDALTESEAAERGDVEMEGYERSEIGERFYYLTRYGSPLAFVRPLDLLGRAGLTLSDGMRVADFGFGSIGQLRLLAALGFHAVGIDVDPLLRAVYSSPEDTGDVPRAPGAPAGDPGSVTLVFGHFPGDADVASAVGGGFDAFISKNTLKRGYVHPEREVDARMLIDLGVEDEAFVRAVWDRLNPGGYFMIYNLCPAPAADDEPYIPWADGRSPFSRELYERIGFEVIAFDVDDTEAAHRMGAALGWDEQMNLETDLFGIYTLVRRP
jgi:hypothetical protein